MVRPSLRRLALVAVVALIAVGLPSILAGHTGDTATHNFDIRVESVALYDADKFDLADRNAKNVTPPDDTDAKRVEFLEDGENPDVTLAITLDVEASDLSSDHPENLSVAVVSPSSVGFSGPVCWDYGDDVPHEPWTVTTTGLNASGLDGTDLTFEAHANDNTSQMNCENDEYDEGEDLTKDNNDQAHTVRVGEAPDLAAPEGVAWCWEEAAEKPENGTTTTDLTICPPDDVVNATNPEAVHPYAADDARPTEFRVRLKNPGTYTLTQNASHDLCGTRGEGQGPDIDDCHGIRNPNDTDGSAPPTLAHDIDVTLEHQEPDRTDPITLSRTFAVPYLGNVTSRDFDLAGAEAGAYEATITLDTKDRIDELDETNNTYTFDFDLAGPDVNPTIDRSDIRTDPGEPYEYDGEQTIDVTVDLSNLGALETDHLPVGNDTWGWRTELNPGSDDRRHDPDPTADGTVDRTFDGSIAAGGAASQDVTIRYCEDSGKACRLEPGQHVLRVTLDPADELNEEIEGNNVDEVVFYLNDSKAPDIQSLSPDGTVERVGDEITFEADIQEADPNFSNVTLVIESPSGNTITDPDALEPTDETQGGPNWTFTGTLATLEEEGTYSWWVEGSDPSGNTFTGAADPATFEVAEWPKNITLHIPENGTTIDWHKESPAFLDVEATINGTGWEPVWNETGKKLNFSKPNGSHSVVPLVSEWTSDDCYPDDPESGTETENCGKDRFLNETTIVTPDAVTDDFEGDIDPPGRWDLNISVRDKAGVWKERPFHIRLQDTPPEINASQTEVVTDLGDGRVDSESSFNVTTNATDPDGWQYPDFDGVGVREAYVNFSHEDGETVNVTLVRLHGNATDSTWKQIVTTGRSGDLPWAGEYTYRIDVKDHPGNWESLESTGLETDTVNVFDQRNPTIQEAKVDPTEEETNVPVTFRAEVDDDTALEVEANVRPPSGSDFCGDAESCSVTLDRVAQTDVYRTSVSFATAGDYEWKIIATDSAENSASSDTGTLSISENLPPTVDVYHPPAQDPDDPSVYYTDPRPQFAASIQDPSGVQKDSIGLSIEGDPVNVTNDMLSAIPDKEGLKPGWNLTYDFRNKYNDTDEISVRVTATDKSNQNKTGTAFRTLLVDASAPTSKLDSFEPRYRAGGAIWNVSPQTEFVLTGSDSGQVTSGLEAVRFTLDKVALGRVQEYDGPFRINESTFPDAWSGPGIYELSYWAVDRAGNQERPQIISVQLDLSGPEITYFPKGRFVNASISDPQGVQKATLHFKSPDADAFQTREMSFSEGLYRGTLPDLTRGETLEYYISATDLIDNVNRKGSPSDPFVYEAGNAPPQVSWQTPNDGATLTGETTFRWQASDEDGDQISFTLEYRLADGDDSFRQLTPVSGRSVSYDTARIPDGTYEIRVTASDGISGSREIVTVTIDNAEEAASPNELPGTDFTLGEPVKFTTQVKKAAQSVTLVVTRDGEEVARTPMRDDGRSPDAQANDNIYTARQQFNKTGTYSWHVEVTFRQDGQTVTEESESGQTFSVEATASQVFERNLGLWVTIIVLAVAATGVGWYGLRNHQQGP